MDTDYLRLPLHELPDPLPIRTLARPFDVSVRPPGSKSLTNRALLLAALAEGESELRGALVDAEDARVMIAALEQLGAGVTRVNEGTLRVRGVGGRWRIGAGGVTLHLENAGTATRFLAAAAVLADPGGGGVTIDGNARMRERPIGELVGLLRALGVRVECLEREGYVPIRVHPPADRGALAEELEVRPTASSQFVSALLLIAPFLPKGLVLRFVGEPTSRSYVEMTVGLLRGLGVGVDWDTGSGVVRVRTSGLYRFDYDVEPDASGATYFWAAAAIVPGASCVVPGLDASSLQGDTGFAAMLESMGAKVTAAGEGVRVVGGAGALDTVIEDLTLMPDAALTLAAVCCFAPGRSVLAGLRTLRVKETDRLAALETELSRVGVGASVRGWSATTPASECEDEALCLVTPEGGIDCSPGVSRVEFETYRDHRMAMAMALIGLRRPNVFIRDPGCVAKTYPGFWRDFAGLYGAR